MSFLFLDPPFTLSSSVFYLPSASSILYSPSFLSLILSLLLSLSEDFSPPCSLLILSLLLSSHPLFLPSVLIHHSFLFLILPSFLLCFHPPFLPSLFSPSPPRWIVVVGCPPDPSAREWISWSKGMREGLRPVLEMFVTWTSIKKKLFTINSLVTDFLCNLDFGHSPWLYPDLRVLPRFFLTSGSHGLCAPDDGLRELDLKAFIGRYFCWYFSLKIHYIQ